METSDRWSCMVTAASEASGISVARLVKLIGHDGSSIVPDAIDKLSFTFAEWAGIVQSVSDREDWSLKSIISGRRRVELPEHLNRRAFTFADLSFALLRCGIYAAYVNLEEVSFTAVPWRGHVGVVGCEMHAMSFKDFRVPDGRSLDRLRIYEALLWIPRNVLPEGSAVQIGKKTLNRLLGSLTGKRATHDLPT